MRRRILRREERGFVLLLSIGFAMILGMAGVIAVNGTVGEAKSAGEQLRDKQAFFRADGSAQLCLGSLRSRINAQLPQALTGVSVTSIGAFVPNNPAGFLASFAGATAAGTQRATLTGSYAPDGATAYSCAATIDSQAPPANISSGSTLGFVFQYRYDITGTGTQGSLTRQVNLRGPFSIQVMATSFAQYALFTNAQTNAAGSTVWFTDRTSFTGPVHTNGQFNFSENPGPRFAGRVTSVSPTARFNNNGSPVERNSGHNGTVDVPIFGSGFQRGVESIPMPLQSESGAQRSAALPGVDTSGLNSGVHLGADGTNTMTGGIYVKGNASITLGTSGGSTAIYHITQAGTTCTVAANFSTNQTTKQCGAGLTATYAGVPNGMIFVDGAIDGLSGTVQRDTQATIAATGNVSVTGNVTYEQHTSGATPSAEGRTNLLGLMSWQGNVQIAPSAPNDVKVHATVMTPYGEFKVENHSSGSPRGTATVLGGVIENTYGAFGTFNAATGAPISGYGRNFVYDVRMSQGMAPPFFPTTGPVSSTTAGLAGRPNWWQTQ
ncbi:MAG: DUF4900 domain-containing protein [Candidatus Methylomirabilales bacterium]